MQRRQFLRLGVTGGALGLLALAGCGTASRNTQPLLLSGADQGNEHLLCGWQPGSGQRFRIKVQQRVHAPLMHPGRPQAVFVARRPGTVIYVLDVAEGVVSAHVAAAQGRHFYGHAVFSRDGRWLFVPENAYAEQGAGKLGVYDANAGYQKVEEFDLQGIGPHQLVLMPDGVTLAIALGGLQTHPEQGRDKLNLATMRSELVLLDSRNGQVRQRFAAPHRHLSLRHLDVAKDGTLVVGAQFQTEADADSSYDGALVFLQRGEQPLQALQAQSADWLAQRHYIASVVVDDKGAQALTTSPRGGVVNRWRLADGKLLQQFRVRDVAGAAFVPQHNSFVVSNGLGQLFSVQNELQLLAQLDDTRWDNHLLVHV